MDVDKLMIEKLKTGPQWPNVIKINDAWEEREGQLERYFIKMNLTGTTLAECLQKGWQFVGAQWVDVMNGIANGLLQPHREQITHGDLKPSNSKPNLLGVLKRQKFL